MRTGWLQRARSVRVVRSARGSQTVEWVLVTSLLTMLLLAVLQVAFALHIRVTLIDAAAEGARYAGLRDATVAEATEQTRSLINAAVAEGYANDISVERGTHEASVRVRAPLPLIGPIGIPDVVEVSASAPIE